MTPLIDLPALIEWLSWAGLVLPATLGLIVLRALLIRRFDRIDEEFRTKCQSIDVDAWHDRRAA